MKQTVGVPKFKPRPEAEAEKMRRRSFVTYAEDGGSENRGRADVHFGPEHAPAKKNDVPQRPFDLGQGDLADQL